MFLQDIEIIQYATLRHGEHQKCSLVRYNVVLFLKLEYHLVENAMSHCSPWAVPMYPPIFLMGHNGTPILILILCRSGKRFSGFYDVHGCANVWFRFCILFVLDLFTNKSLPSSFVKSVPLYPTLPYTVKHVNIEPPRFIGGYIYIII